LWFFIFCRLYKTRYPPRVFQETHFDLKDRNIGRKTREKVEFAVCEYMCPPLYKNVTTKKMSEQNTIKKLDALAISQIGKRLPVKNAAALKATSRFIKSSVVLNEGNIQQATRYTRGLHISREDDLIVVEGTETAWQSFKLTYLVSPPDFQLLDVYFYRNRGVFFHWNIENVELGIHLELEGIDDIIARVKSILPWVASKIAKSDKIAYDDEAESDLMEELYETREMIASANTTDAPNTVPESYLDQVKREHGSEGILTTPQAKASLENGTIGAKVAKTRENTLAQRTRPRSAWGGEKAQHKHNGRMFIVRVGPRGGKYILVKKQKVYI
jgi:hypothetical protein